MTSAWKFACYNHELNQVAQSSLLMLFQVEKVEEFEPGQESYSSVIQNLKVISTQHITLIRHSNS